MRLLLRTSAWIIGIFALAGAPLSFAQTPPALKLTTGSGQVALIDGTGAVTFSGACTPAVCQTTFVGALPGQLQWNGTIGTFSVGFVLGVTKPALDQPSMDLTIGHLTTTAQGSITFQFSDKDFTNLGVSGGTLQADGSVTTTGHDSATFSAYFDNTNTVLGTGTTVGTATVPISPGSHSVTATINGPGPAISPFSMMQAATFNRECSVRD